MEKEHALLEKKEWVTPVLNDENVDEETLNCSGSGGDGHGHTGTYGGPC